MANEALKEMLRQEIDAHDAMLWTTPHLSKIRHAEQVLLSLLEVKQHLSSQLLLSVRGHEDGRVDIEATSALPAEQRQHLRDYLCAEAERGGTFVFNPEACHGERIAALLIDPDRVELLVNWLCETVLLAKAPQHLPGFELFYGECPKGADYGMQLFGGKVG